MRKTRERWLVQATRELVKRFDKAPDLNGIRISCGWPSRNATSKNGSATIGQCFYPNMSAGKTHEIFISPRLAAPGEVLETLLHELCHVVAGVKAGHKAAFKRVALSVGLEGKATATHADRATAKELRVLAKKIGKYPHRQLTAADAGKKQTTRLLKCACDKCGYIARVTRKWIIEAGTPLCPCNGDRMEVTL